MDNNIYNHLILLLGNHCSIMGNKITYNNNETIDQIVISYCNYEVFFVANKIFSTYKGKYCSYREHNTLKSIIDEIQYDKKPLYNFSMFEDIV